MTGLDRLFRPSSVAVIGGGTWCRSVIATLGRSGFNGPSWHVHPTEDDAFRGIGDMPAAPDACFIGVNRHATIKVLAELNDIGAGGAVCFASGFAEATDGMDLNAELLRAAGDMVLVGPNCYGFVNALDNVALWPDVHGLVPVDRGVAILTQSSNIALNLSMQRRGLPVGFLGTAGNQAQIGLSDIARHVLRDQRITALGLHVEGVGDLQALRRLAQEAQQLGKPVIVLKAGRSQAAQTAALSHTASMAGSDVGAEALFARLGLVRVPSLEAMIEALKHAHLYGIATRGPIASLSCSGGEASLMADGGEARGLAYAHLTADQDAALHTVLGPHVTRTNPLDYHTFIWDDATKMAEVYRIMGQGTARLTAIVVDFPRADRCQTTAWDCVVTAATATRASTGKPIALIASLPESLPEYMAQRLMSAGVLPLNGLEAGLDALAALYADTAMPDAARDFVVPLEPTAGRILDESEAKAALRRSGVKTPRGMCVATADQAASACNDLLPVVLKSVGLAHKSESGGVVLGLEDADAVRRAATGMEAEGYYLEEMITGAVAELLVAVVAEAAHGYVLTVGAGGVWTEIWQDTQHLLLPVTKAEVDRALDRLRIAPVLAGYRGSAGCDRHAVIDAVMAVQDYVIAQGGRIAEVEINPLIVTSTDAIAADALIRGDI